MYATKGKIDALFYRNKLMAKSHTWSAIESACVKSLWNAPRIRQNDQEMSKVGKSVFKQKRFGVLNLFCLHKLFPTITHSFFVCFVWFFMHWKATTCVWWWAIPVCSADRIWKWQCAMWLNQWPSQKLGYMLAGHNEILCTNSAMNKLFFILMKSIILTHSTLGNQSVSRKVYLKFGRGIAKLSEKSLTVPKVFVISQKNMFTKCNLPTQSKSHSLKSTQLWSPIQIQSLVFHRHSKHV